MKIKFILYFLVILNLFSSEKFEISKSIEFEGNNQYYKIELDEEIYKFTKNNLEDIRIYDKNNEVIPYYIQDSFEKTEIKKNKVETKLINKYVKNRNLYLELEIEGESTEKDIWLNSLNFIFESKEFYLETEVYGSYDRSNWKLLNKNKIYNIENINNETIEFERSNYQFYKVVFLNNERQLIPKSISGIDNLYKNEVFNKTKEVNLEYSIVEENKTTKLIVKNPNSLPLVQMSMEAKGNYRRNVYMENYNEIKDEIYSFNYKNQNSKKSTLDFYNIPIQKEYIIVIENGDNRKLDLTKLNFLIKKEFLIFENLGKKPYKLNVGEENLGKAEYDLSNFISSIDIEQLTPAKFENSIVIKEPLQNSSFFTLKVKNILLNVIIGLVSVLMITVVIRSMKSK